MDEEDLSNLSDEELLKKIQPGITSDVDKYFIELAHRIVDDAGYVRLGDPAIPGLEKLQEDSDYATNDYEAEKTLENEVAMLKAQIKLRNAQIELMKERQAKMEPSKEMKSPILGIKSTSGGLKTRRSKHRNGPSRLRRHRSRRVSGRKVKA